MVCRNGYILPFHNYAVMPLDGPGCTLLSCDTNPEHEAFPSTKVIDYPMQVTDEQDNLALVDDILNQWGR